MGNRKKSRRKVRTPEERQNFYKNAKSFGGEETEQKNNAITLDGSDESSSFSEYDMQQVVKKPSLESSLSLHWKEILITALIIPVLILAVRWIIDIKADQKYLNRSIEEIKQQLDQLTDSNAEDYTVFVTKDNLELKLEILERDLKAFIPDISAIESKLASIEEEIISLQSELGE